MKKLLVISLLVWLSSCANSTLSQKEKSQAERGTQELLSQLQKMVQTDSEIQEYYARNMTKISNEVLNKKRDSVFRKNGESVKVIFEAHGFPGIDKLGEAGAKNFWLIVQHSDYDVDFQEKVLGAMKLEVGKGNASNKDYAYLVDRVRKNKGQKQLFGTQITHASNMWAIPEPLEDSLAVNERRKKIGLVSIETYLNGYMEMHFEMNPDYYRKKGITEPFAYSHK